MRQNANLKTYEWLADFAEKIEIRPVHQKILRELLDYIPEATWRRIDYEICPDRKSILRYLNRNGYNLVHILNVVIYRKIFG